MKFSKNRKVVLHFRAMRKQNDVRTNGGGQRQCFFSIRCAEEFAFLEPRKETAR